MPKKNTAFISFADPDRDLAQLLSELFTLAGGHTYFAPDELGKAGTPEWRKEIIRQIKNSQAFVPIYTRHSIGRPWVLYESGVADAARLKRFAARVAGVAPTQIDYLPSGSTLYYDLDNQNSLLDLITAVCMQNGGNRSDITAQVRSAFDRHSSVVERITKRAKKRWVFIAGNSARDAGTSPSALSWYSTQGVYEMRLKGFSERLTECLLGKGFSVGACPQVAAVGRQVTRKALSCLGAVACVEPVEFRIGGIYPIDREAREIELSESAKRTWLDHIIAFRKTYLQDQEWLILVGGNEGTQEEYEAADDCNVNTYAVPCFGGTAMRVFGDSPASTRGPCANCTSRDGECSAEALESIAEFLKDGAIHVAGAKGRERTLPRTTNGDARQRRRRT